MKLDKVQSLTFFPCVLSLVSLAPRQPSAEASQPALQTRVPGAKRLCRHVSWAGRVRSRTQHLDSRWQHRAACGDAVPGTGSAAVSSATVPAAQEPGPFPAIETL